MMGRCGVWFHRGRIRLVMLVCVVTGRKGGEEINRLAQCYIR